MPQITAIVPQKRRKDRFNVYLDGQFGFAIAAEKVLKNRLNVGKNLSPREIEIIIAEDELGKLVDLTANFLSFRPRSEKEIFDYLVKKLKSRESVDYQQAKESPLIGQVILRLKKYKYLNDRQFAKWWIESRMRSRPRGTTALRIELLKKGIGREIIDDALEKQIDEKAQARLALTKKIKHWQKLTPQEAKKKAYQFLASRGFDWDTIKETVAKFIEKR